MKFCRLLARSLTYYFYQTRTLASSIPTNHTKCGPKGRARVIMAIQEIFTLDLKTFEDSLKTAWFTQVHTSKKKDYQTDESAQSPVAKHNHRTRCSTDVTSHCRDIESRDMSTFPLLLSLAFSLEMRQTELSNSSLH